MIYILMIVLLFLFGVFYYGFHKELISPSLLMCGMFILSTFILLLYSKEWKVNLSYITVCIIVISIIFTGLGEFMGRGIKSAERIRFFKSEKTSEITLNSMIILLCFAFVSVTMILYFVETEKLAAMSSVQSKFFLMNVRQAKMMDGLQVNYIIQHLFSISEVVSCIFIYIGVHNYMNFRRLSKNVLFYLTIIVYALGTLLETGRARLLNHIIYFLIVFLILYLKRINWRNRSSLKFVMISICCACVFLAVFYWAGYLTGKSLDYRNFFDNIANYTASSIYALDHYFKNIQNYSQSEYFGYHTLFGIYDFLRTLGFPIPDSSAPLEYIKVGYVLTNIYTPFRRYYQDFGLAGLCIIQFLIGFFYARGIRTVKRENVSGLCIIFFAFFYFPIINMPIEERVFMDVIMMRSVYSIVYFLILYKLLISNSLKVSVKEDLCLLQE